MCDGERKETFLLFVALPPSPQERGCQAGRKSGKANKHRNHQRRRHLKPTNLFEPSPFPFSPTPPTPSLEICHPYRRGVPPSERLFFLSRESKKEACDRDCPCQKEEEGTAEEKGRKEIHPPPPPPPLSSPSSPPPPPTSSKKPIVENRAKGASPLLSVFSAALRKNLLLRGKDERSVERSLPPSSPLRWRWPLWPRRLQEERKRGGGGFTCWEERGD